jgi:four helix bundle protein
MHRFLQIARGSASEMEYHALLARDLHFLEEKDFETLSRQADELQRMLTGLMQSIRPLKVAEELNARSSKLIARSCP